MLYKEFIQNIIDSRGQWNVPKNESYENHHIIPRCMGGLPLYWTHTTKHENLIWLTLEEHFIAHKLLAEENPDNIKLFNAWHIMAFPNKDQLEPIFPEDYKLLRELVILKNKEYWETISDEDRIKLSNKISNSLKIYYNNESNEHKNARVEKWKETWNAKSVEELIEISNKRSNSHKIYWASLSDDKYEEICKHKRIILSSKECKEARLLAISGDKNPSKRNDVRAKISDQISNRRFCNNGEINLRIKNDEPLPKGFTEGKLPTGNTPTKGRIWVNNGSVSKMVYEDTIPIGFSRGRLPRNK